MAYDPKDPADVKIVQGLIDAALADQTTEHEADVAGLKTKNTDLLAKLKKANSGENDAAEVARLEGENETLKGQVKDATKKLTAAEKASTVATEALTSEQGVTRKLLVDNSLTAALIEAKVAPQYTDAVTALLGSKVTIKQDGENRVAVVGDKPLGEFVKEWSQGDQGKHYVAAAGNGGGGAPGAQGGGNNSKTMTRTAYDQAISAGTPMGKFFAEGGSLTD